MQPIELEAADQPSDDPKRRLLEAAVRVFHKKGYNSATVQDVADEAGIVKGTLYYHVRAKEDLLFEIMNQVLRLLLPRLEELRELEGPSSEKLHRFVRMYVEHTIDNLEIVGIFFREFDSLSAERRKAVTEARDLYDRFLRELLEEGRMRGEFRADLDVHVTAFAIFGMVNWIYRWYRPDGPQTPESIGAEMADMAVNGVIRQAIGRSATSVAAHKALAVPKVPATAKGRAITKSQASSKAPASIEAPN